MFDLLFGSRDTHDYLGRKRTKAEIKKREEERLAARNARMEAGLARAAPFNPKQRWQELVIVQADTYKPHSLFTLPAWNLHEERCGPDKAKFYAASPHDEFRYVENRLPRGEHLATWSTRGHGYVVFDKDVVIPTLYSRKMNSLYDNREKWAFGKPDPWMSFTPAEFWTLRIGNGFARGHTVIAGLGLGWQLEQVLRRKAVKKVTLIEESKELVEWLMPKLRERVEKKEWDKLTIGIGDANVLVPKLTADVALIDIFPGYGWNEFRPPCPNIPKVWVWGSSGPRGEGSLWSSWARDRGPW